MNDLKPLEAKLQISGTLVFHDAEGNVVQTTDINGSIPLTPEQAQDLEKADDQRSE